MANLRLSFLTAAWRGLKGMLFGAASVGVAAVGAICLLFGVQLLLDSHKPIEQANELKTLQEILALTAQIGLLVGAIAGFAARLPRRSIGMLKSIAVVGIFALLASPLWAIPLTEMEFPLATMELTEVFVPLILAALAGGAIVLVYGAIVGKLSEAQFAAEDEAMHEPKSSKHRLMKLASCWVGIGLCLLFCLLLSLGFLTPFGVKPDEAISKNEAIDLAKKEALRTGGNLDEYRLRHIRTLTDHHGEFWLVSFERRLPYQFPGSSFSVSVYKHSGRVHLDPGM